MSVKFFLYTVLVAFLFFMLGFVAGTASQIEKQEDMP